MNYIAHIHLAHVTNTSTLGNFLGDFIKGRDYKVLPNHIANGVLLHRKIDSFTDQHLQVRKLKQAFPKNLRRMSGVVIDIYFDHLLCLHWHQYHHQSIETVLNEFYQELSTHNIMVSEHFDKVKQGLLTYKWLIDYKSSSSCSRAFYQIEKRLNGRVLFADLANEYLPSVHHDIEAAFNSFYPELLQYSQQECK